MDQPEHYALADLQRRQVRVVCPQENLSSLAPWSKLSNCGRDGVVCLQNHFVSDLKRAAPDNGLVIEHQLSLVAIGAHEDQLARQAFVSPSLAESGFLRGPPLLERCRIQDQSGRVARGLDMHLVADLQTVVWRLF